MTWSCVIPGLISRNLSACRRGRVSLAKLRQVRIPRARQNVPNATKRRCFMVSDPGEGVSVREEFSTRSQRKTSRFPPPTGGYAERENLRLGGALWCVLRVFFAP